ncbi:Hypothetical protein SCF082_LOCUS11074 [Durusdinium trenchii]|uniref:Uncharacterized protein n=1 Tax=Durusdinium trenchii TaxID=1381693 RepID=A0ABP0JAE7_9DINO
MGGFAEEQREKAARMKERRRAAAALRDDAGAAAAEEARKGDVETKGLDMNDWKGTAKRYFDKEEGKELRKLHRAAARQYQTMYGYTIFSFCAVAGIAWGLGAMVKSRRDDDRPDAHSRRRAERYPSGTRAETIDCAARFKLTQARPHAALRTSPHTSGLTLGLVFFINLPCHVRTAADQERTAPRTTKTAGGGTASKHQRARQVAEQRQEAASKMVHGPVVVFPASRAEMAQAYAAGGVTEDDSTSKHGKVRVAGASPPLSAEGDGAAAAAAAPSAAGGGGGEATAGVAAAGEAKAADEPPAPQHVMALVPGGKGAAMIDVTNPAEPKRVLKMKTGVGTRNGGMMALPHGKALYFGGGEGLAVFDASVRTVPQKVKDFSTGVGSNRGGMGLAVDASRNLLLVAGGNGFKIYDITDPLNPVKTCSGWTTGVLGSESGGTIALSAADKIAYVAGGLGLAVVDISDPSKPTRLQKLNTGVASYKGGACVALREEDNMLFVAGGLGLTVYDVSVRDKPEPVKKGFNTGVATSDAGSSIALGRDGRVLVAGTYGGLAVIDASDPAKMVRLSKTNTKVLPINQPGSVSFFDNKAYVAGSGGLAVLDLSDPAHPDLLSVTDTGVLAHAFDLDEVV